MILPFNLYPKSVVFIRFLQAYSFSYVVFAPSPILETTKLLAKKSQPYSVALSSGHLLGAKIKCPEGHHYPLVAVGGLEPSTYRV